MYSFLCSCCRLLAGTNANVSMQMYGDKGKSDVIKLDNAKNNFERGAVDEFTQVCVDLGALLKVRVWHDNSGVAPGWLLHEIVVHNEKDHKDYFFTCNKWLATDEGDKLIERELPAAATSGGAPALTETTYKVLDLRC